MTIIEEHTFRSATLRAAPARATRAQAEADEARGVELEAFLAVLPTLTAEQWGIARLAARDEAWRAAWRAAGDALDEAWQVARATARAASLNATQRAILALLTRDLITTEQFDVLTAPMRAAGVDFDNLVPSPHDAETGEQ